MLRAHRQAWCWQDEYYGLTMDDIRRLERETQLALQEKMTSLEESSAEASADGQHTASIFFSVLCLLTYSEVKTWVPRASNKVGE